MEHDEQFNTYLTDICQEVSYAIGDLVMSYPGPLQTIVLAVISCCVESEVTNMTESARELYDTIRNRTVITTLPATLDPRRIGFNPDNKGDEDDVND